MSEIVLCERDDIVLQPYAAALDSTFHGTAIITIYMAMTAKTTHKIILLAWRAQKICHTMWRESSSQAI